MYFQFAKMVAVLTMVAGGAGILANCLNIFILSRYRVTFVRSFKCIRELCHCHLFFCVLSYIKHREKGEKWIELLVFETEKQRPLEFLWRYTWWQIVRIKFLYKFFLVELFFIVSQHLIINLFTLSKHFVYCLWSSENPKVILC